MSGIDGDSSCPDGPGDEDLEWLLLPAVVHQAIGMARVQLGVGAREALAHLRAHARLTGCALAELAEQVVTGNVGLTGTNHAGDTALDE